ASATQHTSSPRRSASTTRSTVSRHGAPDASTVVAVRISSASRLGALLDPGQGALDALLPLATAAGDDALLLVGHALDDARQVRRARTHAGPLPQLRAALGRGEGEAPERGGVLGVHDRPGEGAPLVALDDR